MYNVVHVDLHVLPLLGPSTRATITTASYHAHRFATHGVGNGSRKFDTKSATSQTKNVTSSSFTTPSCTTPPDSCGSVNTPDLALSCMALAHGQDVVICLLTACTLHTLFGRSPSQYSSLHSSQAGTFVC